MADEKKLVIFDFSGTITNALPDIADVIEELSKKYALAIISNSPRQVIIDYLSRFGADDKFEEILGYDLAGSKAEKMKSLLDKYSLTGRQAVYISDLIDDVQYAHETGIKAIGVTWGLERRSDHFDRIPNLPIAYSPEDLPQLVEQVFH